MSEPIETEAEKLARERKERIERLAAEMDKRADERDEKPLRAQWLGWCQ